MNVTLETERLILRPWLESDADKGYGVWDDPEVRRYTGGVWDAEQIRKSTMRKVQTQAEVPCLQPLVEKNSGAVVGACGLQLLAGGPEIEIGWMLAVCAWGKGYATEMSREVLKYAHASLELPCIYATIDPRNTKSIAVANRLGMQYDSMRHVYERDMMIFLSNGGAQ